MAEATLAQLIRAGRERDGVAVSAPERTTDYSHHEFATSTWKAANLLSHYGVRTGVGAAVAIGPKAPDADATPGRLGTAMAPVFALLGATLLGAPASVGVDDGEHAVLVAPTAWLDRFDVAPGVTHIGYGAPPEAAGAVHFEREAWSENPIEPPEPVAADDVALRVDGRGYTHAALVGAAEGVVDGGDLQATSVVGLDAILDDAATLVAGVLAPLVAGGTIRLRGTDADYRVTDTPGRLVDAAREALDS
jgi:hypothetical protein